MRSLLFLFAVLLVGCDPLPGPTPDGGAADGPKPTASLSTLVPSSGYLDRVVVLQLGGVNTHFEAGTLVDFDDPEIRLTWLFKSPTSLEIFAMVGPGARLGAHDVTVKTFGPRPEQAVVLTLKGGFTVLAPMMFEAPTEKSVQGGLTQVSLLNRDYKDNPFTASSLAVAEGPRLINLQASGAARYAWVGLIDALAPVGPLSVSLTSRNPIGQKMTFRTAADDENAPRVLARPPVALSPDGAQRGEKLPRAFATNLYQVNAPEAGHVLMLSFERVGVGLLLDNLISVVAPGSGRFADGQYVSFPSVNETMVTALAWLPEAGPSYVAVFAGSLGGGADLYSYDVSAKTAAAARLDLTERQPDSAAAPLATVALDGPVYADSGAIEPAADVDYIRFKPGRSGRVHAQATGTQAYALKIGFLQSDCVTALTTSRGFQHEAEVEDGKEYCLRLSAAASTPYRLILTPAL